MYRFPSTSHKHDPSARSATIGWALPTPRGTARSRNATRLVVGRPRRRRLAPGRSVGHSLLDRDAVVDLVFVPGEPGALLAPARGWRRRSPPRAYLGASAVIGLCGLLAGAMAGRFEATNAWYV